MNMQQDQHQTPANYNHAHRRRCYFCHQVGVNDAYSTDICLRHQLLISIRLFILLARSGRFGKCWRVVKW